MTDTEEVDALLADGSTVQVRPIRPDDGVLLVRFHRGLSRETVRFRFFSAHPELSDDEVRHFTHVDGQRRQALVAIARGELIGIARYDTIDEGQHEGKEAEAEAAFVVADRYQGRGVGTLLLEHLAVLAHQNGLQRFVAEVLPENHRMLHVFESAGFKASSKFADGAVHITLDLAPSNRSRQAIAAREHRAEVSSLTRVLRPRSVAVVGASRSPGKVGHEVARAIIDGGFTGEVHLVNQSGGEVLGLPAAVDLRELDASLDLVIVAIPAPAVADVVEAAGEHGAAGAVVLTDGFAEAGPDGVERQRDLLERARGCGVRIIGPNCLGIINTEPAVRLDATFAGIHPPAGPIGFYTQSGAVGIEALAEARLRGLGLASFVSVGNKADVSGNDLLHWWADDPDTVVIGMYLESFGNPVKFRRLARQLSTRKPIVALKAGRTDAGARAAASHTAAIASSDRLVDALFHDAGVVRVASFEGLFDTLGMLSTQPLPGGPRVGIVTNSGGAGILAADALADVGLTVAELPHNPIDLRAEARPESYRSTVAQLLDDGAVDAVIAIFIPTALVRADDVADALEAAVSAHRTGGAGTPEREEKPVVGVFLAGATPAAGHLDAVIGIPTSERAARALAHARQYRHWRENLRPPAEAPSGCDPDAARAAARDELAHNGEAWLPPQGCARLLATVGVDMVPSRVVTSASAAAQAIAELGAPVAVKAVGAQILHKSDVGGVILGVSTPEEAQGAYERLEAALGAQLEGALVQAMAGPGEEVIIGAVRDLSFGALVLFGAGGTRAEILDDRAFRLSPFNVGDAADMVSSTRLSKVLDGWRGEPPLDRAGLESMLDRIAHLVDVVPEIAELDVNPVIVGEQRCWVVDARIRLAPAPADLDAVRRLR